MNYKSTPSCILIVLLVTILLSGCLNSTYEGIISAKNDEFNRILVIKNVSKELIEDKDKGKS